MSKRLKAYAALLTTAFIWGLGPPIIKYSFKFITPVQFLFYRFLIVSSLIAPILIYKLLKKPIAKKDLARVFLVSICGTSLTLGLLFEGLNRTSAVDAGVLAATSPLLIVVAGAIFLKEKVTQREKIGLGLAFFGTLIAVVSPLLNGNGFATENLLGNFLIILSHISWTVYTILGKKLAKKYPSFSLTGLAFVVGAITYLPIFLYHQFGLAPIQGLWHINPQGLPSILYMSLLGSIIAYFTYAYGMSLIEASEATLFTYLQPIFTLPLAVWWLGEEIKPAFITGAILIILGVVLTEFKSRG